MTCARIRARCTRFVRQREWCDARWSIEAAQRRARPHPSPLREGEGAPTLAQRDVGQLEAAVTTKTKCILPVHLFGQCVRMETVRELAQRRGIKVLEDCAQSHGALRQGVKAGAMSDAAAFSFYPTKILGGYGD